MVPGFPAMAVAGETEPMVLRFRRGFWKIGVESDSAEKLSCCNLMIERL